MEAAHSAVLATLLALLAPGRCDRIEGGIDLRPVPADAADHVPEHARDLLARGPLAESQERQDRLPGVALEDVDRLEAVPAGMHIEQRELLAAVHEVVGVVDVERD